MINLYVRSFLHGKRTLTLYMGVVTTYCKGTMTVTSRLVITVIHFVTSEDAVTYLFFLSNFNYFHNVGTGWHNKSIVNKNRHILMKEVRNYVLDQYVAVKTTLCKGMHIEHTVFNRE